MTRKIVHFVIDDKFIDNAIDLFDSLNYYQNEYYILTAKDEFKYIKSKKVTIIRYDDIIDFVQKNTYDILILHSFYSLPSFVIVNIPEKVRVIWFSWGYDIYENTYPGFPLVPIKNLIVDYSKKKESIPIAKKIKITISTVCKRIDFWNDYYFKGGHYGERLFKKAVKRIDYYSGVFPSEFYSLQKNRFFKAKPFRYNYPGRKETHMSENIFTDVIPCGYDIQVGHSAAHWVNHAMSFSFLNKLNLRDRKIICPLSYGDDNYANHIVEMGSSMFKENFIAIRSFMPYDEYEHLTNRISVFVIYAMRQGAVGNIIMNLWHGAKVFLPKDSIGYQHFSKMGITIFSIEKDLTQENIDTLLSRDDVIHNRRILSDNYSYDVIRSRLIQSLSSIN